MFKRMTAGEVAFQFVAVALVAVLCVLVLYPFLHVFSLSFSAPQDALRVGLHILPRTWSLDAYREVFRLQNLYVGMSNTLFRTVVGTFLSIVVMSLGAYPLSKKRLPHRTFFTMLIVFTLFFSGGLIPTYMLIKDLGLYDSRWALIVPMLSSTFTMFIMRNFFMSIPEELEESAKIDGANDVRILLSLILPLSKPILATVTVWVAVTHWNAWFDALIFIQDPKKMVMQIYLRKLFITNDNDTLRQMMEQSGGRVQVQETLKSAVLMVTMAPIIVLYPFLQKHFIKGIMVGSLKG